VNGLTVLEWKMVHASSEERYLERYAGTPVVRAIAQAVAVPVGPVPLPVGAFVDNFLLRRRDQLAQQRMREFLEELSKQSTTITPDRLEREDGLVHAIVVTVQAVARARRTEKIHMFAHMLANYDRVVAMGTEDDYEEMLRLLDDLSVREYQILLLLRDFEERAKEEPLAEADAIDPEDAMFLRASEFWGDFRIAVERTGVPRHQVRGMLARLRRTGMYDSFMVERFGNDGEKGRTTPLFDRFLAAVERHEVQHPAKTGPHPDSASSPQGQSRQAGTSSEVEQLDGDVETLIATLNRHSEEIMQGRVFAEDSAQVIREMREERDTGMASA
jgi:hypothetical protein